VVGANVFATDFKSLDYTFTTFYHMIPGIFMGVSAVKASYVTTGITT
jgi:hypothetical protein